MNIFDQNNKLIELFQIEIRTNPESDSELVSLIFLDMTVKNGGLTSWFDYGPIGIDQMVKYAELQHFANLQLIGYFARTMQSKYTGNYAKFSDDEIQKMSELTEGYYAIMDDIIEKLYQRYLVD